MSGHFISHPSDKQCLGGYEGMEEVSETIQSPKPEPRIQQVYYGRQNDQNMCSGRSQIQKSRMGKQYESFNDKGGLNEPDYEAIARGIERAKRDRQERVVRYYRTAQEEHERRRAEVRSRIEASQRAIEQVRGRKSGIKDLTQKLFERVRITVQKRIEWHQRKRNDYGRGMGF